jgi:hypothetical protein
VPLLGVIDFLPFLSKPCLSDIEHVLGADLISGQHCRPLHYSTGAASDTRHPHTTRPHPLLDPHPLGIIPPAHTIPTYNLPATLTPRSAQTPHTARTPLAAPPVLRPPPVGSSDSAPRCSCDHLHGCILL